MKIRNCIAYTLISLLMVATICITVQAEEKQINTVTFRSVASREIFVERNLKISTKKHGEGKDSSFYMITGLNSSNIEIKAFMAKKVVWNDNLHLIKKLNDGTIYLEETTGAGFVNVWTIALSMGVVICTKQYPDVYSKKLRVVTYINSIESAF